jgi:hypothetical protein
MVPGTREQGGTIQLRATPLQTRRLTDARMVPRPIETGGYLMRESGIPSRLLPGPAGISLSTGAVPLTALATREETL